MTNLSHYYEDNYFYYVWKPHGLPSTFGTNKSALDILENSQQYNTILAAQSEFFDRQTEYGLVNRLDNDTAGLLYFAKNPLILSKYKEYQSQNKVTKRYIADIKEDFNYQLAGKDSVTITYSIAHHKYLDDRMVVVTDTKNTASYKTKIRGHLHHVETEIELLYYAPETNISTLSITITKGIRHQIRAHLASIGYPILGDQIYNKKDPTGSLRLYSIGLAIDEPGML